MEKTEGVVFAIGNKMYVYSPITGQVREVASRKSFITAIEVGYRGRKKDFHHVVWDACSSGIRDNDKLISKIGDVTGLLDCWFTNVPKNHQVHQEIEENDRESVLVAMAGTGPYRFTSLHSGKLISEVPEDRGGLACCYAGDYSIYWQSDGNVYRGMDRREPQRRFRCDHALIVPCGAHYQVMHYGNEDVFPDGTRLSTPENDTFMRFDPHVFGFYDLAVIFEVENSKRLFLATTDHSAGVHKVFVSPICERLVDPTPIFSTEYVDGPYGNSNPCRAMNIKAIEEIFGI